MTVDTSSLTEDQKELFEERAAIMEYDGEMPRDEAEREAYKDVVGRYPGEPMLKLGGLVGGGNR